MCLGLCPCPWAFAHVIRVIKTHACFEKSKLPFWSLWFGQFCHFSPNLKLITSGSLWFAFCCHFSPNFKFDQISLFFDCCNLLFCPLVQGHFGHFLNFIFFVFFILIDTHINNQNPQTS
ncbi:hypothetical protein Hanom_Chr02g00148581 [Helianthus anomalus]